METTEELNIRISFGRKSALFLLVLSFLCWHPGFIGSESLVLTTYYPAPYGGYVRILTTDQTLLARDGGRVGIGTTGPANKLDVNGDIAISGKHAFRGNDTWLRLNQDGAFTSGTHTPGNFAPSRLNVGGAAGWGDPGAGNVWITGNVGINTTSPTEKLHVAGNIRIQNGNLNIGGDGVNNGFITGICYTRNFGSGTSPCNFGYRVMASYGTTSCTSGGQLFLGGDLQNPGRWRPYIIEGCAGTMLCCRIRDW